MGGVIDWKGDKNETVIREWCIWKLLSICRCYKIQKTSFYDNEIRDRLSCIIADIFNKKEEIELVESTVAYNHIHVLVKTQVDPSKVGQLLFGASSRILRKEFPVLVEQIPKGLWGGKSFEPIVDKNHLDNCISYIRRHQPDNTKI